jgi:CheY-like chemotaxis protein
MGVSKSNNERQQRRAVIFIVDDEPVLLELAQRILDNLDYEILTFGDPQSALKAYSAAQNPPDLLITDFAMHEMDGMALIRWCRRIHPKQKIILVSGTVDESVYSGAAAKPDRFLAKPYQPAQLATLVQELLTH